LNWVAYDSWIKTVFPKKQRVKRDTKKREPALVDSSAAGNIEEWIPQHHLKKESTPKKRKGAAKSGTSPSGSS
jgi:hypothetical protein